MVRQQWRGRFRSILLLLVVVLTVVFQYHQNVCSFSIAPTYFTMTNNGQIASSTNTNVNESAFGTQRQYYQVSAAFFPLEGFLFLPLHVSILLYQQDKGIHKFDFLPVHPRDPNTLQTLISMKPVPGFVRYTTTTTCTTGISSTPSFVIRLGTTAKPMDLETLHTFCKDYQHTKGNLHLITNNCFSFAYELYKCILEFST